MSSPFDPFAKTPAPAPEPIGDQEPVTDPPPEPTPEPTPPPTRPFIDRLNQRNKKPRAAPSPGKTTAGPTAAPKEPKPTPRKTPVGGLVKPLTDFYTSIGMMVFAVDQQCGTAVLDSAESCAIALDKAAHENDAIRRVVHRLIETSVTGQLIAAHAPIALAIARHHLPAMRDMQPVDMNGVRFTQDSPQQPDEPTTVDFGVRRANG